MKQHRKPCENWVKITRNASELLRKVNEVDERGTQFTKTTAFRDGVSKSNPSTFTLRLKTSEKRRAFVQVITVIRYSLEENKTVFVSWLCKTTSKHTQCITHPQGVCDMFTSGSWIQAAGIVTMSCLISDISRDMSRLSDPGLFEIDRTWRQKHSFYWYPFPTKCLIEINLLFSFQFDRFQF